MFFLCLLLLFVASPVSAQTIDLEKIVLTASRYEQDARHMPSSVTVISQDDIKNSHAQTVSDVLKGQSGLQVTDNSSPKTVAVDIRGFGDTATRNVLVLVNHRRMNPVDNSGPDFLAIPLESIDHIEIIRGAASVLYGDNAVGGVINIITKKGKTGNHAALSASYGSYDTLKTSQEFYGGQSRVDYYFNTQQYETDGYRANSQLRSRDYVGRVGVTPVDPLKLDVKFNWHEDRYGLTGGLKDAPLALLGPRGTANPEDYASTKDRMVALTADLNPWGQEELGHFIVDTSFRNRDTYAVFYSFGEYATKRNINSWGINGRYVLERLVDDKHLNLAAGVDYYTDDNWIYGSAGNSDNLTITKNEIGAYLNGSYEFLEHLFLEAGTRYDKAYYTFNQVSGTKTYQKHHPDKHIASGGLRYEYGTGSNVFANVNQTFRFLTTDDWFDTFNGLNTALNQQKGIQYQAGVKHRFDDILTVGLTPYWIDNRNEIFLDPAGGGGFGATSNYDKTRRIGVEYEQNVDLKALLKEQRLKRLSWKTNYTYQHAAFPKGLYKGNEIPMAPRFAGATSLTLGLTEHMDWMLQGRYTGRQFAINDAGNVLPQTDPYFVMDTRLSYAKDAWEIFGEVDNLLDTHYDIYVSKAITSSIKSHFPAAGRSYNAGIKVTF